MLFGRPGSEKYPNVKFVKISNVRDLQKVKLSFYER